MNGADGSSIGPFAKLRPHECDRHVYRDKVVRSVHFVTRLSLVFGILLVPFVGEAALQQSHFDVVAFGANTGETATDTPIGVLCDPAPILDGVVNLMLRDGNMPVYLTDGPNAGGVVLFGFVDEAMWTPSNADGNDLSTDFNSIGDRVYASVDDTGFVELISAANFRAGEVIATATVTLEPNKAFTLTISDDFASLWYGDEPIAEGVLVVTSDTAHPATLGNDFVISVLSGNDNTGSATINHLARDAKLRVADFPRVLRYFAYEGTLPFSGFDDFDEFNRVALKSTFSTSADVLTTTGTYELGLYLTNIGTTTAANIQAVLSVPPGVGMSIVGSDARDYGTIGSAVSTLRTFTIRTSHTAVGVYPLTLTISGGASQTLETWVPVWDVRPEVHDFDRGLASTTFSTPFGDGETTLTAPEVIISPDEPYFFNVQRATDRVAYREPFYGAHWGDPLTTGPVFIGQMVSRAADYVEFFIRVKTRSGTPINDGKLTITGGNIPSSISPQIISGQATVGPFAFLEAGRYSIRYDPAPSKRKFWNPWTKIDDYEPGEYEIDFTYPDIPAPGSTAPNSTPANGQGLGGKEAGKPDSGAGGRPGGTTPTAPNGGPPSGTSGGGAKVGQSVGWGLLGFVAAGALDGAGILTSIALAPATAGGSLPVGVKVAIGLSALGSAAGGAITAKGNDPAGQDIRFFAQNQTVPLDPLEQTLEEWVDTEYAITTPTTFNAPLDFQTSFTYTRITDQRVYTYSATEPLTLANYLPLTLETDKDIYDIRDGITVTVRPQTATGETLRGADVVVHVYLFQMNPDRNGLAGDLLLQDDGQAPDVAANDGVYTAHRSIIGVNGILRVMAWVGRTGFYEHQVPPSFGYAYKEVRVEPYNRSRYWKQYR